MHAYGTSPTIDLRSGIPPASTIPRPVLPRRPTAIGVRPTRRWGLAQFATAALLLLTIGLGVFALGPRRSNTGQPAVLPAVVATPATPDALATADEMLLTVTFPADAIPRGFTVGSAVDGAVLLPGARSPWRPTCCPGPLVEYVIEGAYTVRAEAPIRVLRTGGTVEEVPAGTEVVLGPGDGLVSRHETVVDAANTGSTPVTLLSWLLIEDDSGGTYYGDGRPNWTWINGLAAADIDESTELPDGPLTMRLRRTTVAANATLPAPPSETLQLGVALAETNAAGTPVSADIAQPYDGSILNRNQQAVTLYVVTLEPANASAPTSAPTQSSTADDALLRVTLPAEAFPRKGNIDSMLIEVVIPPGTRSTWQPVCCPGPMIEYVVAGALTVRAEAVTQVLRADGTTEEVPAESEVTLEAGDALVPRNEIAYEAANTGTEPVLLVNWVVRLDDSNGEYLMHQLTGWALSPNYDEKTPVDPPAGAATVRLRRVTLAAGEVLPAPPAGTLQLGVPRPVATARGVSASMPLKQSIVDGSIGNPNQQPVDVYLLTLEPV